MPRAFNPSFARFPYCGFSFCFGFSSGDFLSSGLFGAGCPCCCCCGRGSEAVARSGCERSLGGGVSGRWVGSLRVGSGRLFGWAAGARFGSGCAVSGRFGSGLFGAGCPCCCCCGRGSEAVARSGCERSLGGGVSGRWVGSYRVGSGRLFGWAAGERFGSALLGSGWFGRADGARFDSG